MKTVVDILFAGNPKWNLFHHCFCVQQLIRNILALAVRVINGICFLVIDHYLVFRGCTKQASKLWNHDCLFWQEEGCGGDVFSLLIVLLGLS